MFEIIAILLALLYAVASVGMAVNYRAFYTDWRYPSTFKGHAKLFGGTLLVFFFWPFGITYYYARNF